MVEKIEFTISGLYEYYAVIDVNKNIIITKNGAKLISNEYINDILNIVKLWKQEYGVSNIIDSEKFILKINGNVESCGKGVFPNNYGLLKEKLGELYV